MAAVGWCLNSREKAMLRHAPPTRGTYAFRKDAHPSAGFEGACQSFTGSLTMPAIKVALMGNALKLTF